MGDIKARGGGYDDEGPVVSARAEKEASKQKKKTYEDEWLYRAFWRWGNFVFIKSEHLAGENKLNCHSSLNYCIIEEVEPQQQQTKIASYKRKMLMMFTFIGTICQHSTE